MGHIHVFLYGRKIEQVFLLPEKSLFYRSASFESCREKILFVGGENVWGGAHTFMLFPPSFLHMFHIEPDSIYTFDNDLKARVAVKHEAVYA